MRLVLIGASGHGKVCAEIAELVQNYDEILFLDDNREITACGGHQVVGVEADYRDYVDDDTEFFVSIGNVSTRRRIQEEIENAGGRIATLIHPYAVVSKGVFIGAGTVIMAGAVINTGVIIGKGVIVNTSSSIDHDCKIGEFSHISVGTHLCGTIEIGEMTWLGAGAIVSNNLSICHGCTIGAGAVVIRDISELGIYVGVPARKANQLVY